MRKLFFHLMNISIHKKYKIQNVRDLTDTTYVVRMNRYGMEFIARHKT